MSVQLWVFIVGVACVIWGPVTFFLRDSKPEWFRKYQRLLEEHGESEGKRKHTLMNVVLPSVLGVIWICLALFAFDSSLF